GPRLSARNRAAGRPLARERRLLHRQRLRLRDARDLRHRRRSGTGVGRMTALLAAALAGIAAALVTPPPTPAGEPTPPAITGTITGPDASPPPADALVRVWLESESARHEPARRVAETSFPVGGRRFPIPFTLAYPAADIDPAVRYHLRALISAGKRVL